MTAEPTASAPVPATTGITSVDEGRRRIDELDDALLDVLAERQRVSAEVQRLRRESGGPRIQHARENEIVRRYVNAVGRPGATLALTVLEVCRGPLPPTARSELGAER